MPFLMAISRIVGMTRCLGPSNTAVPPLQDLIRRDRNHPSSICWSLANTAGSKAAQLAKPIECALARSERLCYKLGV